VTAPRVSVIMLTYRRVEALKQTVASFRRHADLDDYERIVCDDGSSVDERREIERLGADVVIWNTGAGYGDNANSGIAVLEALPELGLFHYSLETILPRIRARTEYVFARHVNEVRGPRLGWISGALAFFHVGGRCPSLSWEMPRAAAAAL
jgi:glycosyltransferase involved in cell wall biosynthesis